MSARADYVAALAGAPPEDFVRNIDRAVKLTELAMSHGLDHEDVWLIAAAAAHVLSQRHVLGLVERCKQVCSWVASTCSKEPPELAAIGSREQLANQAIELTRQIANGIFQNQGFILLVFDLGLPGNFGYLSHASSISKADQAKVLRRYLERLEAP